MGRMVFEKNMCVYPISQHSSTGRIKKFKFYNILCSDKNAIILIQKLKTLDFADGARMLRPLNPSPPSTGNNGKYKLTR